MRVPIGELLAGLAMETESDDAELLVGAIVIFKLLDADGDVMLRFESSEGIAILERIGMLETARAVELADALGARS